MAKPARRYEIHLPLTFNDGRNIPRARHHSVERRLLARFVGITAVRREFPLRGIWVEEAQIYVDQVIVMTAVDFRPRGSAQFIARLKRELLREFDQREIFITESLLRVH